MHFLNQVDESDLLAIIEDGDEDKPPVVCTCNDRCYPGHVDTSCPVCAVNMGECTGKEPEPVKPEPQEPKAEKEGNASLKVLGKIDLDNLNKKPAEKKAEATPK